MASYFPVSSIRPVCFALLLLVSFLHVPHVSAQSASEKAAAEALFDRGLALLKEGKVQEACERLEQSQAIERGIGTMLYLADCYERLGKTASAWALFREASSLAHAAGQSERADAGRRRAERLDKSLSRLTINVPATSRVPGLQIESDGGSVHPSVWGVPVPADPGAHRVAAKAPGYLAWSQDIKVEANGATAELTVPALQRDENAEVGPVAAQDSSATGQAEPQGASAPPAREQRGRMSIQRIIGISAGSAGVVALAVATGFGVRALNKVDDANALCGASKGEECGRQEGKDAMDQARSSANVSTAMTVLGSALVVGGVITFLLAPKYRGADVAVRIDRHTAALQVGGVF